MSKDRTLGRVTLVYSVTHFTVDFTCVLLMTALLIPVLQSRMQWLVCVTLYNFCAFALQLPAGAFGDRLGRNPELSACGCGLIMAAWLFMGGWLAAGLPGNFGICEAAAVTAGFGNAFFHVGGGVEILGRSGRRAALPGIYVSTGALGVFLAGQVFRAGAFGAFLLTAAALLLLAAAAALLLWIRRSCGRAAAADLAGCSGGKTRARAGFYLICLCLFLTVCLRSCLGTVIHYSWNSGFLMGLLFTLGVAGGKALGGILGDRFGWCRAGTFSLLISAGALAAGFSHPFFGILGILCFNMTMPLTLTALGELMPGHRGLAFGMTTFALFLGIVPSLLGDPGCLGQPVPLVILVLLSALLLFAGLRMFECRETELGSEDSKGSEGMLRNEELEGRPAGEERK